MNLLPIGRWSRPAGYLRPASVTVTATPAPTPAAPAEPPAPSATEETGIMSEIIQDAEAFGGIVSDLFDGKASLEQAGQRLGALATTIGGQVKTATGKVESLLGPQAVAAITTGAQDIQQAAGGALMVLDDDVAPYLAAGAKAAEGALDTVMDAAIPGGSTLNTLVNGGIDAIASGLKAAIDGQAAAWKAKLAGNAAVPVAPAGPAPLAVA